MNKYHIGQNMHMNNAKNLVLLFKVLANDARLSLVDALSRGDKTVWELCDETGLDQARVSHELRCLTVCGFSDYRRNGKEVVYSLNKDTVLPIIKAGGVHARRFGERMGGCTIISEAKTIKIKAL